METNQTKHYNDPLRLLLYVTIILGTLYFGRTLFIPLAFSLFISFILYPFCKWLEKKKISRSIAIAISMFALFLPVAGLMVLLVRQLITFGKNFPELKVRFFDSMQKLILRLAHLLDIPVEDLKQWFSQGISESSGMVIPFLKQTVSISSVSLVLLLLIPVYVILILYYRNIFVSFLNLLFPSAGEEKMRSVLEDSARTYYNFVKGMIVVYLCVGVLNSLGLFLLGIPDPVFFGFLTSVLTIIPYVGIAVGGIVPVSIAWMAYDSLWYPLGVVGIFAFVQILEANIIFPLAVGQRLNLNPLVVLIAVVGGGVLWGVSGMILFIPFIGILKLIADKIPSMKIISLILGRG